VPRCRSKTISTQALPRAAANRGGDFPAATIADERLHRGRAVAGRFGPARRRGKQK
jgi:hypothetical protein